MCFIPPLCAAKLFTDYMIHLFSSTFVSSLHENVYSQHHQKWVSFYLHVMSIRCPHYFECDHAWFSACMESLSTEF